MELLIGAILGLGFFIIPTWMYRKGLKDGLNIRKDKPLEPIRSPMKIIKEHKEAKETKKQSDLTAEGWKNIMHYNEEGE